MDRGNYRTTQICNIIIVKSHVFFPHLRNPIGNQRVYVLNFKFPPTPRPIYHPMPKTLFGNASQVSCARRAALHFPTLSSASSAPAHLRALKRSQFPYLFIDLNILLFLYPLLFTDVFIHNLHYKLFFCFIAANHVVKFSFICFSLKLVFFFFQLTS